MAVIFPGAPENFVYNRINGQALWDNVQGAIFYRVRYSDNGGQTWTEKWQGPGLTCNLGSIDPGTLSVEGSNGTEWGLSSQITI